MGLPTDEQIADDDIDVFELRSGIAQRWYYKRELEDFYRRYARITAHQGKLEASRKLQQEEQIPSHA